MSKSAIARDTYTFIQPLEVIGFRSVYFTSFICVMVHILYDLYSLTINRNMFLKLKYVEYTVEYIIHNI